MSDTPVKHTKLDLLHKGIYPGIAILIAMFAVYQGWTNSDKQRQIDGLRTELAGMADRQANTEKIQKDLADQAQALRVDLCRRSIAFANYSNSPMEADASYWIKLSFANAATVMELRDIKQLGEAQARDLWTKARKLAEKDVKDGDWKWAFVE